MEVELGAEDLYLLTRFRNLSAFFSGFVHFVLYLAILETVPIVSGRLHIAGLENLVVLMLLDCHWLEAWVEVGWEEECCPSQLD